MNDKLRFLEAYIKGYKHTTDSYIHDYGYNEFAGGQVFAMDRILNYINELKQKEDDNNN
jgi:hypothetical protein